MDFQNRSFQFFYTFFVGVFPRKKAKTSSKFFKYVFSKFGSGLGTLPSKGNARNSKKYA